MNLNFTEEQEILRKFAYDFLNDKFQKKFLKEIEESELGYSPQVWKEMAELGWMGLPFPDKYGGTGMTLLDQSVLFEEMGRAAAQSPYFATVMLGAYPIYDFGNEYQKEKFLPGIIKGDLIFTMALSESMGHNLASIQTNAVKSGGKWVINGTKLFVPFAHAANYILCLARVSSSKDEKFAFFIVDKNSNGLVCSVMDSIVGKPCEVKFENVEVDESDILGQLDSTENYLSKILNKAEVALCSEMSGLGQRILDMTVQYAKDRKQFGRPIGSFQIIQHYAADMFIELEGLKLNTYKAAWKMVEGLPCDEDVAIAKAWAIQASEKIISLAHQIHGAIGSTLEYDLHYFTRRMKVNAITLGDLVNHREKVAVGLGL